MMWKSCLAQALVLALAVIPRSSAAASISTTFSNNVLYRFDTNGNAIDLTSDKIDYLGGAYIWYGLPLDCGEAFCGVASYSSTDLKTWYSNGLLFDPSTSEIEALCLAPLSGNCGRPHIVYSAANNDYILWVNAGSPGYVTFSSKSPSSGFTRNANRALVGFQPPGPFQAGDFTVHVIDGTGYLVYSLIDFTTTGASIWPPFLQSMYVQALTSDMRNTTGSAYHVVSAAQDLVDFEAESPDIFKRGDYFYITASNTCGFCDGTLLIVYRSKTLAGPWLRQIISADTCGGQSGGVLTLPSPSGGPASYLHIADIVRTAPLAGTRTATHGHQIQQLAFNNDGTLQQLDCSPSKSVTVTLTPGVVLNIPTPGRAISATDGSGELEIYSPACNLPSYQLYQTWASSKSGSLTEVGVNVATIEPTGNLTITIFRYSNNTNFYTPRYVWETLTTYNVIPQSEAFEVVRVPVNAAVKKGDRLGIALVSASVTPMCTLVTTCSTGFDINTSTRTLFAIGANQVSYRGSDGKKPPIQVLGTQIKWYAIVK